MSKAVAVDYQTAMLLDEFEAASSKLKERIPEPERKAVVSYRRLVGRALHAIGISMRQARKLSRRR